MASYYKYAEREVENQIDWSKIGKDVSKMLSDEVALREEKKAAIEKATQEYGDKLSKQPVGADAATNKIMADFANDAQELRLTQDRLLKGGYLKLRHYNMMRQNAITGTNNMFDFADEYNTQFEVFKKRLDGQGPSGKYSSEIEAWRVKKLETFAAFRNTKPTFNPATGELSLSEMVDDGSGQMVPKEGLSFSTLRNMLYEQTDQFDVLSNAKDVAGSFTSMYKKVIGTSGITTRDDVRQMPEFKKALGLKVDAALEGNPYAAASILVDYLEGYTMKEGGEGGKEIDMKWDEEKQTYMPNLSAGQLRDAKEAYKFAILDEMKLQEEYLKKPKPTPTNPKVTTRKNTQRENLNLLMDVFEGTQAERENALLSLGQGRWENFRFEETDGVVQVFGTKSNKSEQLVGVMNQNNPDGMIDWIEGAGKTLTNDPNLKDVIDDSNYDDTITYDFNPNANWDQAFQIDVGKAKLERESKTAETWYRGTLIPQVVPNEIDGVPIGSMEDNDIKKIADHFNSQSVTPSGFSMNASTFGSEDKLELIQNGTTIREWVLNEPNPSLAKQIREQIWIATKSNAGWREFLLEDAKEAVPTLFEEEEEAEETGGTIRD
jgi:hypothetical protein